MGILQQRALLSSSFLRLLGGSQTASGAVLVVVILHQLDICNILNCFATIRPLGIFGTSTSLLLLAVLLMPALHAFASLLLPAHVACSNWAWSSS